MTPCERTAAPPLLAKYAAEVGEEYARRREADPSYRFQWPKPEGQSLFETARQALRAMTRGWCSYCDGTPMDATGEDQVDHFRPKSRPEFYRLVCEWQNLLLCCAACNKAKASKWDERLLRPDEPGFLFERFFDYRFDTGELAPNPAASSDDQARASTTIDLLALNRPGACVNRRRTVGQLMRGTDEFTEPSYRFLRNLVAAT